VMAPEHCCSSFVIAHVEATDLQARIDMEKGGQESSSRGAIAALSTSRQTNSVATFRMAPTSIAAFTLQSV
jgi:hypothetical protein